MVNTKSFAQELSLFDMTCDQIPYKDHYFDHVICCGTMHFVGDLSNLFVEVERVMKHGGIFAFTIASQETKSSYIKDDTSWGIPIFKHSSPYIMDLLNKNGFKLQKEQRLLIKGADKIIYDMLFSALVAEYQKKPR